MPDGYYYDEATNSFRKGRRPRRTTAQRSVQRSVVVPAEWSGKCIGVIDGDTITVMYGSSRVDVQLYGIDAPERRQAYGSQAKSYARSWALNKQVKVFSKGRDAYGRVLGWVFRGRSCLNSDLVRNGGAWWARKDTPQETGLSSLEQGAKKRRIGLWRNLKAVAPWAWRAQNSA